MPENRTLFPERLRELLEKHNMTYTDLSNALGINKSTISMWKSGKIIPKAETILLISDYFKVSPDYLMGRDETHYINYNYIAKNVSDDIKDAALALATYLENTNFTEEDFEKIKEFAEFLKSQKDKK